MSRLEISLLGSFDVRLDGEQITRFETDAARALLAYLALNPGVVFSRDKLASLLWDGPTEAGLNNLRPTLHRLRRAIEADESAQFLEVTRYSIKFEADSSYWLDVEELRGLLSAIHGHAHRRPSACPVCLKRMERAVILYQDGLLPYFDPNSEQFYDWLTIEREQIQRQMVGVLQQLWEYYNRRGQNERAEEYVRHEIDLEPLNEDAYRRLMYTLILRGERNAALAQYRQCVTILKKDFDLEPEEKTIRLYETIRTGDEVPLQGGVSNPAYNLPTQLTSFIGRESEMNQLIEWLTDPLNRLVTITGLGGIGKTRLALAVAQEMMGTFEHGVWWASLADLDADDLSLEQEERPRKSDSESETEALITALTNALKLPDYSGEDRSRRLFDYLRPREVLLVIDRFEHLVEAGREFIINLLHSAPRVYILVTSRRRLNLQAERFLELSGLSIPENGRSTLEQADNPDNGYASLRLFAERAGRVGRPFVLDEHNLPSVIEICQLVEGMPLAIELAAARIGRLSPNRIARAIRDDLHSLSAELHDLPSRHRNVRSLFEGSWRILALEERQALAGLAVFHNDFEADAAVQIVGATEEILDSLADQSLLHITSDGRLQLHELLRQFAQEKLDSYANAADAHDLHCVYYLDYLADRETRLYGELPQLASNEIGREWDNVQDAWEWAVYHDRVDDLQRGLKSLARFCSLKGWMAHCKRMTQLAINEVLERLDRPAMGERQPVSDIRTQSLLCRLYLVQAGAMASLGDDAQSETLCRQALEILAGVYDSQAYVEAGLLLSGLYRRQGNFAAAHEQLDKLLSGTTLLLDQRASIFYAQGEIYFDQGRLQASEHDFRLALVIFTQIGDAIGRIKATAMLGGVSYYRGWIEEALHYSLEFLELSRALEDRRSELEALSSLGLAYMTLGDANHSRLYLERALDLSRSMGDRQAEAEALFLFGRLWRSQGDLDAAWSSMQLARGQFAAMGHRRSEMDACLWLGQLAFDKGDIELARDTLSIALDFFCEVDRQDRCGQTYALLARLAVVEGRLEDGRKLAEQAVNILEALSKGDIHLPLSTYLDCIHALQTLSEEQRATSLLQDSWVVLQERVDRIQDPIIRASYLDNVATHCEIVRMVEAGRPGE